MKRKYLIIIGGPTAVGKTAFAIRTALHFQTEILSADSRQFFRGMNIGTAKPSPEELAAVPHHFIDCLSIRDSYSVGDFERDALQCLSELYTTRHIVVMSGGSGLYVKAVCEGLDVFPPVPPQIAGAVIQLYAAQGLPALQEELRLRDPDYYAVVDLQNPARLIRALSVCRAAGQPFSSFRSRKTVERDFTPVYIQLDRPRAELYSRIEERVDHMMRLGLEEEARLLYPHRHLQALQTVGYQEMFDYFEGKTSLETAVALIKQHTRNYAKRQLTWMRRDGFWNVFHPEDWEQCLNFVEESIV